LARLTDKEETGEIEHLLKYDINFDSELGFDATGSG